MRSAAGAGFRNVNEWRSQVEPALCVNGGPELETNLKLSADQ
jgi:hypothetical protein